MQQMLPVRTTLWTAIWILLVTWGESTQNPADRIDGRNSNVWPTNPLQSGAPAAKPTSRRRRSSLWWRSLPPKPVWPVLDAWIR